MNIVFISPTAGSNTLFFWEVTFVDGLFRFIFSFSSMCTHIYSVCDLNTRCLRELTAILDREAFTELHLSFRLSMMMMKPMLAASRLETGGTED